MGATGEDRQFRTLERLLAIQATDLKAALTEASQLVAEVLSADKVDVFLHDPTIETLVAVGTSDTPMGRQQHALGLGQLPLANGGRAVEVYQTGRPHRDGRVDADPHELLGVREALGVRSTLAVPLDVAGERRGVLQASSAQPECFSEGDLAFLAAVAGWVGTVAHRAELVEQLRAEAAERARRATADELVAALAHDLRNPLQAVSGQLGMLRNRARREEHAPNLESAEAGVAALGGVGRMIADLLDAS